jgi:hypothetical protein
MSYFDDPSTLPSPLDSMEGVGNPRMEMPLSVVYFVYTIVQQTSTNYNPTPPQELDPVIELIWAQYSLSSHDPFHLVFPFDKA